MNSNKKETYSYAGYLTFKLFRTSSIESNIGFNQVLTNLPRYEEGSPESPGYGFTSVDLPHYLKVDPQAELYDYSNEDSLFTKTANKVESLRYINEEYEPREVYDYSGQPMEAYTRTISEVDLFWMPPNFLFVRGNKTDIRRTNRTLSKVIEDRVAIREVNLNSEFLLWLFYKYVDNQRLPKTQISISRITSASLSGDIDEFGGQSSVSDSVDISRSLPIIAGLLRGQEIDELGGHFRMADYRIEFTIDSDASIHIKTGGSLSELDNLRRMLIALNVQYEFLDLYQYWEQLPNTEKYIPKKFYDDLVQFSEKLGFKSSISVDDRLKELDQLRNSDS